MKAQDKNKVASHRVNSKTSVTMETVLKLERKVFHFECILIKDQSEEISGSSGTY